MNAGGVVANGIAQWNGSSWMPCLTGVSHEAFNPVVNALEVHGDRLYVGGIFDEGGGSEANNIASIATIPWFTMGDGTNESVRALVSHNGKLVAGGYFTYASNMPAKYIAAWNGSTWSTLGAGVDGDNWPHVRTLTVYNDKLIAAGRFVTAGADTVNNIAAWHIE